MANAEFYGTLNRNYFVILRVFVSLADGRFMLLVEGLGMNGYG